MKNIYHIALLLMMASFVGCQKEDLTPEDTSRLMVPTWESPVSPVVSDDESARTGESDDDAPVPGDDTEEPSGITDPNNDPDGNSKKGKGGK